MEGIKYEHTQKAVLLFGIGDAIFRYEINILSCTLCMNLWRCKAFFFEALHCLQSILKHQRWFRIEDIRIQDNKAEF